MGYEVFKFDGGKKTITGSVARTYVEKKQISSKKQIIIFVQETFHFQQMD